MVCCFVEPVALGYLDAAERGHAHVEEDAVENGHGDELRDRREEVNVTFQWTWVHGMCMSECTAYIQKPVRTLDHWATLIHCVYCV